VKTYHCIHHVGYYSATDPLEAEYDKCRTSKIPGLGLIHSPSTHLDLASTNRRSTKKQGLHAQDPGSLHRLILYVTTVSRDGRPFLYVTTVSTTLDKTSPLRHPQRLCLLLPYKKEGRGLYEREREKKTKNTNSSFHCKRSTPQAISFVFSLSLLDLRSAPSLTACNPYAST
jgi:hypothetical protein